MDNENQISYRNSNLNDSASLQELGLISYGVFKTVLTPDNFNILKSRLEEKDLYKNLIEKADSFIAECNNKIVGMAFLMPSGNPNHIYAVDWSVIRMLGVHPEYKGRGIANKLTQLCIDQAKQNGEKIIALHTSPEIMQTAIRIYLKAGFVFYKDIEPIFGVRYQVFKMEL